MKRTLGHIKLVVPDERIEQRIYLIRGQKVMLDRDLAKLYGVSTKALNQAVRRHQKRFPEDFMFQLSWEEARIWWSHVMSERLRSHIVTLKRGQHIKFRPRAFTEHGILMLSSVLNSEWAIQVNIAIMRAFVKLRQTLALHKELAKKLAELERNVIHHDAQIQSIFDAIRSLTAPPAKPQRKIGFRA